MDEEDRPAGVELDGDSDRPQERGEREQDEPGADEVERALDGTRGAGESEPTHREQGDPVHIVQLDGRADDLGEPGQHTDPQPHRFQAPRRVQQVIGDPSARRDDRPLDSLLADQALQVVVLAVSAGTPVAAVHARTAI